MKVLYLNPPVLDPTAPYCSLYQLKGYIEEKSEYDVVVKDINIEWLNYMLTREKIDDLLAIRRKLICQYENADTLSKKETLHYYKLKNPEFEVNNWEGIINSIQRIKDSNDFYSIDNYLMATHHLHKWEKLLSSISFPAQYKEFKFDYGVFESRECIADIISNTSDYELGFFEEYVDVILHNYINDYKPNVIGISISMKYQIKHALYLARYIRAHYPKINIIAGGTYIHQIYNQTKKNGHLNTLEALFSFFDFCMVGEGEQATVDLLNYLDGRGAYEKLHNVPYIRTKKEVIELDEYQMNRMDDVPPPNYENVNWSLYFSPDKMVCYVPSLGCYWGKCSFCDYGLNSKGATTKWREKSVNHAIRDLIRLKKTADIIYFSVDALSPRWILSLSKQLVDLNLEISWGAEIRLDYPYTREDAELMFKGGCIAVSIGLESANADIIEKINKGGKPYEKVETLTNLSNAGIAIFPMTFIGFPGETYEQAMDTLQYLEDNSSVFAFLPYPSTFYLEGDSEISSNAEKYDLLFKEKFVNLDIINGWYWAAAGINDDDRKKIRKKLQAVCNHSYPITRPFLSTDTPHALMYIKRYGSKIINKISERNNEILMQQDNSALNVSMCISLEDVRNICNELDDYAKKLYRSKIYPTKSYIDEFLNKGKIQILSPKCNTYIPDIMKNIEEWGNNNFSRNMFV